MDVHNQPLSEQIEADTSLKHRWTHGGIIQWVTDDADH